MGSTCWVNDFCLKAPAAEAVCPQQLTSLLTPQEAHSPCHCFYQVTFIDHEAEPLQKLEEGIFFFKDGWVLGCGMCVWMLQLHIISSPGGEKSALNLLHKFPWAIWEPQKFSAPQSSWRQFRTACQPNQASLDLPLPEGQEENINHYC